MIRSDKTETCVTSEIQLWYLLILKKHLITLSGNVFNSEGGQV